MEKQINFIVQAKGGVGKSAFTYMIANHYYKTKEEGILFVDMDNESATTINQIHFSTVNQHNLVDEKTDTIDRALIGEFFADFMKGSTKKAYCDFGANSSDQFQKFFANDSAKAMLNVITQKGVEMKVFVIVAGENAFDASYKYAQKIVKTFHTIQVTVMMNRLYSYSEEQIKLLKSLTKKENVELKEFGIAEKGATRITLEQVKNHMEEGKSTLDSDDFMLPFQFEPAILEIKDIL